MEMIPAAISGAGALMNMFSDKSPPTPPPVWHPPNMNGVADQIQGQIGQNLQNNVPQQLMPQYQNLVGGLNNNPYAALFQGGGAAANMFGNNAAGAAAGGGDYLSQLAHAIGQNAFDPQNALYARTQQQVQEQARAGNEARGLNSTPYGAGVENKAMGDFNIDWQNNALQRMIGGGNAAGGLMNSGVNLSAMAPQLAYQAGQYPWQAFNTMGQNSMGNLDRLAQAGITAQQIPNQAIQQWLGYIGAGNQANAVSNQQAQVAGQNNQLGFNQAQTIGNQFGQAFNSFNKAGGMGKVNSYFNAPTPPMGRGDSSSGDGGATGWG